MYFWVAQKTEVGSDGIAVVELIAGVQTEIHGCEFVFLFDFVFLVPGVV